MVTDSQIIKQVLDEIKALEQNQCILEECLTDVIKNQNRLVGLMPSSMQELRMSTFTSRQLLMQGDVDKARDELSQSLIEVRAVCDSVSTLFSEYHGTIK